MTGVRRPFHERPYRRGVGIVLINAHGLVFAGRRIGMGEQAWQMPQGGIDPDESPLAAALRELKEEVGTDRAEPVGESRDWLRYDLPEDLAERVWRGQYRGQEQKWFAMRFLGSDRDIDLASGHPEFDAWRWVEPVAMMALIAAFKRPLYRAVLGEFGPLLVAAAAAPAAER
jgi:putative (di)nucleoside polyphosphate hydrolase